MKLIIKPSKPRNPYAVAARQRKAGEHLSDRPARQERRALKASLRRLLSARDIDGNADT